MSPRVTEEGDRAARRVSAAVLFAFVFLSLYFAGVFPPYGNPNELSRLQAVVAMAEWRTFAIDRTMPSFGAHEDVSTSRGRFYSNKAPGLAFAAYPVYEFLRLLLPAPRAGTWDATFYLLRILTVTAVCSIALARFAARVSRMAIRPATAPLVTAAVALGTPYLYYARSFFSHAWTAALLFLAWDALRRSEETPEGRPLLLAAGAGFLASWAAVSEYTVAPIAILLAVRCFAGRDLRRVAAFAVGGAVPLCLLLYYDAACFGSPWILSSAREAFPQYADLSRGGVFGFRWPSLEVARAYLLDPARGVLIFSPFLAWSAGGLVKWWRSRQDRADFWFVAGSVALFFVVLTAYPNWHGGWALGSRYLLPGVLLAALPIPFALETAASRGLFVAAASFSVANHLLLTSTWTHFPLDLPWPAANGSLWFLARGWVAPNLGTAAGLPPVVSLLPPAAVTLVALALASGTARPARPPAFLSALLGVAALLLLVSRAPQPAYSGRLWRAAMLGAISGRDASYQEFLSVAAEASTPQERRLAGNTWRRWGPRREIPAPATPR